MVTALPSRIMNYRVSADSPTEELMTLGQIFAEVGDYMSTILDREHLSLSRRCGTMLKKVVGELISRQSIRSVDNLYDMPLVELDNIDLSALTISELQSLYRLWPQRHKERDAEGREHYTFYYEGRIVRELRHRKAANQTEQLKIDYCVATYNNELDNMSFVFSCPVQADEEKIFPDSSKRYSPDELTALISLYRDYRDIMEREILVEYADYALDMLAQDIDTTSMLGFLAEMAELGRKKIIRIPGWINKKLEDTIKQALVAKTGNDVELSFAMLTLQMLNGDTSLIDKARRIINRCYKSAFEADADLGERVEKLHAAVTSCDYVSRFSVRKVAAVWHELVSRVLSSCVGFTSKHMFQLLEIARECEEYADISDELRNRIKQMLEEKAKTDSTESNAYARIASIKF